MFSRFSYGPAFLFLSILLCFVLYQANALPLCTEIAPLNIQKAGLYVDISVALKIQPNAETGYLHLYLNDILEESKTYPFQTNFLHRFITFPSESNNTIRFVYSSSVDGLQEIGCDETVYVYVQAQSRVKAKFEKLTGYAFPTTNIVQDKSPFPGVRLGAGMTGNGTRLYMYGGSVLERGSGIMTEASTASADLWSLDVNSFTWTWHRGLLNSNSFYSDSISTMRMTPGARLMPITWFHNNRVFIFGGIASNGYPKNDLWYYSIEDNLWHFIGGQQKAPGISLSSDYPGSFRNPSFFVSPDDVWIYGGLFYDTNSSIYTNDIWRLNKETTQWTFYPSGTFEPPKATSCQIWVVENTLVVYGGFRNGISVLGETWIFDISGNRWDTGNTEYNLLKGNCTSTHECSPGPRGGGRTWVGPDGDLYFFGGYTKAVETGLSQIPEFNDVWKLVGITWFFYSNAFVANVSLSAFYYDSSSYTAYSFSGRDSNNTIQAIPTMYTFNMTKGWETINFTTSNTLINFYPDYPKKENSDSLKVRAGSMQSAGMFSVGEDLYLYGGTNGAYINDVFAKKWKYNTVNDGWSFIGQVTNSNQFPRVNQVTWLHNNTIYIFGGGSNVFSSGVLAKSELDDSNFQIINGSTNDIGGPNWPSSRYGSVGWSYANGLYLFGGQAYQTGGEYVVLNDLWAYNLVNDQWNIISGSNSQPASQNNPGPRVFAAACSNEKKAWIFGGQNSATIAVNSLYEFDISDNTWSLLSESSTPTTPTTFKTGGAEYHPPALSSASMVYNADSLFVFGGRTDSQIYKNDLWEYNLSSKIWFYHSGNFDEHSYTKLEYPIYPSHRSLASYTAANNKLYLYGGFGPIALASDSTTENNGFFADLWSVDLSLDQFCGNGIIEEGEECEFGECCETSTCSFKPSLSLCRSAFGECDAADYCNGLSASCTDTFLGTSVVCKNATGLCDAVDYCSGSSSFCVDTLKEAGFLCRFPVDVCDFTDFCLGNSSECVDNFEPYGTQCGTTSGSCDVQDYCFGNSSECFNILKPSGQLCRSATGDCDVDDFCDGVNPLCINNMKEFGTRCRNATGDCDVDDFCLGNSTVCIDTFIESGVVCRHATGTCDADDVCSGNHSVCVDTKLSQGTVCDLSLCQVCDGIIHDCPTVSNCTRPPICGNGKLEFGENCESPFSACCNMSTCQFLSNGTVCREFSGDCDLVDYCNGLDSSCENKKQERDKCGECGGDNTTCICDINNGGCDTRVTCHYSSVLSRVVCGDCPVGYGGDGYFCSSLCGDGNCNATIGETCVSCPRDCNATFCDVCGDSQCNGNETCSTCSEDCGLCTTPVCVTGCSNHGRCVNAKCVCDNNWSGPSCSTAQNEPIIVDVNNTKPEIVVTAPEVSTKFKIGIKNINELDSSGKILKSVSISGVQFTLLNSTSATDTLYNYSATLENGAFLNIIIRKFENTVTIEFANITTTYTPNTLKLAMRVQSWPFSSILSSLSIVLESSENSSAGGACYNDESDSVTGHLRWLMVVVNNTALYGQFLDKAIIDGRNRNVNYSLNSDNTVSALLPHFWDYADMDPNYSILLGDENVGECADKTKETKNKTSLNKTIIAIVIPVVVGSIIIAALAFYFKPRIATHWKLRKLKKETKMETTKSSQPIMMEDIKIEKAPDMEITTATGTYSVKM